MAATAAADGVGWSSKQVQRLMTVGRDWQAVRAFYRAVVNGHASLELLGVPVGAPATPQDTAGPAEAAGPPPLPAQPGTQPEGGAEATRPELREAAIKEEEEAEEASSAVDCAPSASTAAPCGAAEGAQADGDAAPSSHKKKRQKRCSSGNSERNTYRLAVAYEGEAFDGWMHQDGLNTVEGALLQALRPLSTTTRVSVASAGRTDKGVSAFGQVCSFYSWDNIPHAAITAAANAAVPGSLRIHDVQRVPRRFHATFSASWRHYVYLLPLRGGSGGCSSSSAAGAPQAPDYDDDDQQQKQHPAAADGSTTAAVSAGAALPGSAAATGDSGTGDGAPSFDHPLGTDYTVVDVSEVDVGHMDAMLRAISGRSLNFSAFARDTPPGKECTCVIHAARATRVTLPAAAATAAADSSGGAATDVVCIQLVANRFLRKMVRVLVGTLARESIAAAARYPGQADALVRLCEDGSRGATAVSAPPTGLCFVAAGYEDEAPRL